MTVQSGLSPLCTGSAIARLSVPRGSSASDVFSATLLTVTCSPPSSRPRSAHPAGSDSRLITKSGASSTEGSASGANVSKSASSALLTSSRAALERIRNTIALDSSLPWTETLAITYPETMEVRVSGDLNRKLASYKQALHCANTASTLTGTHSLPFTRPSDYFAEMVKSDVSIEHIRQRLLDEGASIKKSEGKQRESEGRKFGKQVLGEKLKEREESKKELEEVCKNKDVLNDVQGAKDDDAFDVTISVHPSKRARSSDSAAPDAKIIKISCRGRDAAYSTSTFTSFP